MAKDSIQISIITDWCKKPRNLGCWTDKPDRAIAGGIRLTSNNPIEDCHKYAIQHGFSVFAVQSNACFTAANAAQTYYKYGYSSKCRHGRGGAWAQNVYIVSTLSLE